MDMVNWVSRVGKLICYNISAIYCFIFNTKHITYILSNQEAFGKINGHYNVPCPIPPHLEAEGYHGDDESIATAFRLYRWVNKVHQEYHMYANGKYSRLMNEERVEQLRGIGFTLFD